MEQLSNPVQKSSAMGEMNCFVRYSSEHLAVIIYSVYFGNIFKGKPICRFKAQKKSCKKKHLKAITVTPAT